MTKLFRVLLCVAVFAAIGAHAMAESVTFEFDPADFFNFRHYSEGFQTDGGMFRLHQTGGFSETLPIYDSDTVGGWATLDAIRTNLDDSPEQEGIGYIQNYLLVEPDPTDGVQMWGQMLTVNPAVKPTATAPPGWSVFDISTDKKQDAEAGEINVWVVQWVADSPDDYIRPTESHGLFSFTFDANEDVTMGEDYTIWFGGDNFPKGTPGISYGPFTGGLPSDHPTASVIGTAYEATLSLAAMTPVPEPATIFALTQLALMGVVVYWRRRRR